MRKSNNHQLITVKDKSIGTIHQSFITHDSFISLGSRERSKPRKSSREDTDGGSESSGEKFLMSSFGHFLRSKGL
jgi:hypothetical protein